MFVRFRERINDGREPDIAAKLQCAGRCHPELRGYHYLTGCPFRPRCRWLIGGELVPYRLLVAVIENRRVGGKVRQEYVADLGAIGGHWLSAFWAALPPERADAIRGPQWWVNSITARSAFWNELEERLNRLSNRITAVDADKIRASVHERVPRPSAEDIEQVAAWNVSQEPGRWDELRDGYQGLVDLEAQSIAGSERLIEESRQRMATWKVAVDEVDQNARTVKEQLAHGDRTIMDESAKARKKYNIGLGQILTAKAFLKLPK